MNNFKEMNQKDLRNVVGGDKALGTIVDYTVGKIPGVGEIRLVVDLVKAIASEPPAHAYYRVPAGYNGGGTAPTGAHAVNMIA